MRLGVAIKLAISNEQLAIQVSAPPTILLYAGFGGERALRAIIKMPRSAPFKSCQPSAVARQPFRNAARRSG